MTSLKARYKMVIYFGILPVILFFSIFTGSYIMIQINTIARNVEQKIAPRVETVIYQVFENLDLQAKEEYPKLETLCFVLRDTFELRKKMNLTIEEMLQSLAMILRKNYSGNTYDTMHIALIDTNGVITATTFEKFAGLDTKVMGRLWEKISSLKYGSTYFVPINITSTDAKPRSYIYTKLADGNILVIFGEFSTYSYYDKLKIAKKLSIYLDRVGVYNTYKKPIFELETPNFPQKIIQKHPYIRDIVKETKFENIPGFTEKVILYVRLNFFTLFSILLVNILAYTLTLLSIQYAARRIHKILSSDLEQLELATLHVLDFKKTESVDKNRIKTAEVLGMLNFLEENIHKIKNQAAKNKQLYLSFKESFHDFAEKLAIIAESLQPGQEGHIKRVQYLTRLLLENIDNIDQEYKNSIIEYSALHDIGKIFVPSDILLKPGPLTDEEREIVRQHTMWAEKILSHPELKIAREIALYHHENYDGTGYPLGLKGEEIPFPARVVKIVNTYDMLRSERPYKKAYTHKEAMKIFVIGDEKVKPSHFDPHLLKVFIKLVGEKDPYEDLRN